MTKTATDRSPMDLFLASINNPVITEYSSMFPAMPDDEFRDLADDIAANGIRSPNIIIDKKGAVVDGRHRLQAIASIGKIKTQTKGVHLLVLCVDQKVDGEKTVTHKFNFNVKVVESEDEAKEAAYSANIHRRHLTLDQRAALAASRYGSELKAKAAAAAKAGNKRGGSKSPATVTTTDTAPVHADVELAKLAGVGHKKARAALKLVDDPAALKAVVTGEAKLDNSKAKQDAPNTTKAKPKSTKAKPKTPKAKAPEPRPKDALVELAKDGTIGKLEDEMVALFGDLIDQHGKEYAVTLISNIAVVHDLN